MDCVFFFYREGEKENEKIAAHSRSWQQKAESILRILVVDEQREKKETLASLVRRPWKRNALRTQLLRMIIRRINLPFKHFGHNCVALKFVLLFIVLRYTYLNKRAAGLASSPWLSSTSTFSD